MKDFIKTDIEGYVKDVSTGAVININTKELDSVKEKRRQFKLLKELQNDVAFLKAEVEALKKLIKEK